MPNERNDSLRPVKRTWQEIAEEASHEQDSAKLKQLSEELACALEERDKRLHPPRLAGRTIPTVENTLHVERLGNLKGQSVLCFKSVESLFLTFPTLEDAIGGLTGAGAA